MNGHGSADRRQGSAFRRVNDEEWLQQIEHDALKDNSCE